MDVFLHKLGFVFSGMFIIAGVVLLLLLVIAGKNLATNGSLQSTDTKSSDSLAAGMLDGPNAVSDGMAAATKGIGQAASSAGSTVVNALNATGTAITNASKFVGNTIGTGFALMFQVPVNAFGVVARTPSVSALIQPGYETQMPVITAYAPAVLAAHAITPTVKAATSHAAPDPSWPIHGRVTTLFGVPHWPYQPTHTGIDISSGRASGVTQIKPFAPGKVVETNYSAYGLGNHVIVDHGGGITSVYAHLNSISVTIGQKVDIRATLGYEGSTGASTGTHLHFEIRQNGQPANPQRYVDGHP